MPALRLAELILRDASVEQRGTDTPVSGFLLDLAKVFELRVRRTAGGAATARWAVPVPGAPPSGRSPRRAPQTDLVWYGDAGQPLGVADAKYKVEREKEGFPNSDLHQMFAYCTVLGLPSGHPVYARGREPYSSHQVRRLGIVITQHALDLDQGPEAVLAGVARVVEHIIKSS